MYKLYKVKIEYEYLVGINEEDDVHVKVRESYKDALNNERFEDGMIKSIDEITHVNEIPAGWEGHGIPYGDDIHEATIDDYNLKKG